MKRNLKCLILILAALAATGCAEMNPLNMMDSNEDASKESTIGISPVSQTLAAGGTIQFKGTGGVPPYTYTASQGNISTSGLYTAPASISNVGEQVTVSVVDNLGYTATANITLQGGSNVITATYAPSPASPGAQVTIHAQGGSAPYKFQLISGLGKLNGNIYTAPLFGETASVLITDSVGNSAPVAISVNGPTSAITALTITPGGTHQVGGGGCGSGYSNAGAVPDAFGGLLYGDQVFCKYSAIPTGSTQVLSNISVTGGGGSCPAGMSSIGSVTDCPGGACGPVQQVCASWRSASSAGQTVTDFYVTPGSQRDAAGTPCAAGYQQVGLTSNCSYGYCYGMMSYCAAKQ